MIVKAKTYISRYLLYLKEDDKTSYNFDVIKTNFYNQAEKIKSESEDPSAGSRGQLATDSETLVKHFPFFDQTWTKLEPLHCPAQWSSASCWPRWPWAGQGRVQCGNGIGWQKLQMQTYSFFAPRCCTSLHQRCVMQLLVGNILLTFSMSSHFWSRFSIISSSNQLQQIFCIFVSFHLFHWTFRLFCILPGCVIWELCILLFAK